MGPKKLNKNDRVMVLWYTGQNSFFEDGTPSRRYVSGDRYDRNQTKCLVSVFSLASRGLTTEIETFNYKLSAAS